MVVSNSDKNMSATRDYTETIHECIREEPAFATGLLEEALSLFLNDEPDVTRLLLRDLVNATLGFERLADEVGRPSKSLHRMLSAKGNPTMNNLAAIISALRRELGVREIEVATALQENLQSDCVEKEAA